MCSQKKEIFDIILKQFPSVDLTTLEVLFNAYEQVLFPLLENASEKLGRDGGCSFIKISSCGTGERMKTHKIVGNTRTLNADKFVRSGSPAGFIKSELDLACESILRRAKEQLCTASLGSEYDLHYEYKGIRFEVEVFQECWDAIIKLTLRLE